MRLRLLSAAVAVLLATTACGGMVTGATSPDAGGTTTLSSTGFSAGTWASTKAATAQQGTCGDFKWTIASLTATSVSGSFSATCNGTVQMSGSGSAQATLTANGITWSSTAVASVPGNNNCAVSLNGTAKPASTGLSITHSGTTCLGAVSGTEILAAK